MSPEAIALGGLWFVVFLLSTTCHEAAHALVAALGGDQTAARAGQVTLNPLPHMRREPWGMVLIPILSYFMFYSPAQGGWMIGWASAPYDPVWRMNHPRRAGAMALAGPAANLLLALAGGALLAAGLKLGWFMPAADLHFDRIVDVAQGSALDGVGAFLSILFSLNIILFTFNLLPVPPLDGATALGLVLPERAARQWTELSARPIFALLAFLAAWYVFPSWVLWPVYSRALEVLFGLGG